MNAENKTSRTGGPEEAPASGSTVSGEMRRPWRLVLLGAPGVGKGTQGDLLSHRLGMRHISTGDLFRAAGSRSSGEKTPAMAEAMTYMHRGELVPDATVWALVREQRDSILSREGFLLDGFPRTLAQAELLKSFMEEEKLPLTAVVDYEMPHTEIVFRLSGRRICAKCKAVFHVSWRPSKVEGVCDECGGRLYRRDDDNPDSIAIRLEAYQRSTAPLIEFYEKRGMLTPVSAVGNAEEVYSRTVAALQTLG
jgi:adenylate kinase